MKKPADEDVKVIDDETGKLEFAEEIFFKKHCLEITERIQKLLFPQHINNYEKHRQMVQHGET